MSFKAQARKIFSHPSTVPADDAQGSSIKIAFVCTANICRSAYAHHGLQQLLSQEPKLQSTNIEVSSAGLLALTGEPIERQMFDIFNEKYKVYQVNHSAKQLSESYCKVQDLILVMTADHRRKLLRENPSMFPKVFLFSEFVSLAETIDDEYINNLGISNLVQRVHNSRGQGISVADVDDPYKRSENTYRRVCNEIDDLLMRLVGILSKI